MMDGDFVSRYKYVTKQLMQEFGTKGENAVFSPFSIMVLLLIAADATAGKTKEEIESFICGNTSYEELRKNVSLLQSALKESGAVTSSNAVVLKKELKDTITPDYESRLARLFEGKLFITENIVETLNEWVRENTKGMIDGIVDESMSDLLLSLLNAITFEAEWKDEYEDDQIYEEDFHNADGSTSEASFMYSEEQKYVENDAFKGFIKQYKDVGYSFMALLPKSETLELTGQMLDGIDFTTLFSRAVSETVDVGIPEFKADFEGPCKELLERCGVRRVFTPEADFSPMSSEWLMAQSVLHKAHIEVDRRGTRAAAVSAMYDVGAGDFLDNKEVILNRPFVYAIMHDDSRQPVFVGVMNHI